LSMKPCSYMVEW